MLNQRQNEQIFGYNELQFLCVCNLLVYVRVQWVESPSQL